MHEEGCNPLLRLYRERSTLLGAFFSRIPTGLPYHRARIVVRNGKATLKAGSFRIACFDGTVLSIPGHATNEEYVSDVYDEVVRKGCELFNGRKGMRAAGTLDPRWGCAWYTLAYDKAATACTIPYPFRLDVVRLKVYLPLTFFACFLHRSGTLQAYQQPARFRVLDKLHEMVVVPDRYVDRVRRKMLEMRLDAVT